ncbi:fumarylacetoacetate hydrolase family protein [Streptomyces bauhiniae]|uniref:fumarylacetoacetate hydrolase family protein n=1 Tax=Streptomyces bauhiniae TaxID=2340725 RepID=UPI0035D92E71
MRVANLAGRLILLDGGLAVDVETASGGRFPADPQQIYPRWAEFRHWAVQASPGPGSPFSREELGAPAPAPRQLIAIGLNYRDHISETGFATPEHTPSVFTKFVTSVTGPMTEVRLPKDGHTDWEVELVVVVADRAFQIREADAWSHVAGLTVGQDISERVIQLENPSPQFSLAKSYPGFSPMGPCLVTPDEFEDPDDLRLGCTVNGDRVQFGSTRQLIFSVPVLIAKLSAVMPLLPGDLIYTGTPAGVGLGRTPPRWLRRGDELISWVEGIGELRQRFVG